VLNAAQSTPVEATDDASTKDSTDPAPANNVDQILQEYLDAKAAEEASATKSGQAPDVNVVVIGDELFITSADPELLNQFEELMQKTMQAVPPRVTWTIFTLRVADATEAANMLKLLFPGSSVSAASSSTGGMMDSLTSGAASLGGSLRDLTGLGAVAGVQTLKIIPDNRQNALFVSGPIAQVREVEEMLKVIDATNLGGDSLRDKLARLIPVENANVDDVYAVVKDVYKNYIDPPRIQENNNPFAMLAAGQRGGGGRGDQGAPATPKLAVGVDKTTSNLIVWADDALYQEISTLVQSMDQAAQEARRTVRVVNLENTNTSVVRGALGSLMPQVKVSVTGSRQSGSTTPAASSGTTPSSGPTPDQMRQMFQQRMGGGNPGGGFGGGNFGSGNRGGAAGGGAAGRTGGARGGR